MNAGGRAARSGRLVAVGMLVILAVLAPAAALAKAPERGTLSKVAPAGNQTSWEVGTSGRAAEAVAAYPADCIGVSDYPHQSAHDLGYAAAQVRTECRAQRTRQYASGELYRDRWYGPQFLDGAASSTKWTYGKVRAIPRWKCYGVGTYTYHVYGYHEVSSGTLYYKYSSNSHRFGC